MPSLGDVFSAFYTSYVLPSFNESATWMARITDRTPGSYPLAGGAHPGGYDPFTSNQMSMGDGSYGVGYGVTLSDGTTRSGFMPPSIVTVGVMDNAQMYLKVEAGEELYEGPLVLYPPTIPMQKGDLLALQDGRRFRVEDQVIPAQVYGQNVVLMAKLEAPRSNDILFTIPLA